MKNYLFISLLAFTLLSCTENVEELPSSVLSEDSMVKIMIDIHLLESAISIKNLPRDSSVMLYALYEKDLFKKYGISDSTYKNSFTYYSAHPEFMKPVYERVVDSLSWREEKKLLF